MNVDLELESWLPSELTQYTWDTDNDFSTLSTSWQDLGYGNFILSPYSVNLFID